MITEDLRFERIESEYIAMRKAHNRVLNGLDKFNAAFQELSGQVEENRIAIQENRIAIQENRKAIEENRIAIQANRELLLELAKLVQANTMRLDAIIKHLEVDYKPPMGFVRE